jgi:hypothetical protein
MATNASSKPDPVALAAAMMKARLPWRRADFKQSGDRPAIVLRFASHRLDIPLPLV